MIKIKCLGDIEELEMEHTCPKALTDMLYKDLEALHEWADCEHSTTLEDFYADDFDFGYIAILDGTESVKELEDCIGLTGGYENTIPESAEIYHWGTEKWIRVIVIYNDSYSMVLWIKNYNGFDSYATEPVEPQAAPRPAPF